MTGIEIGHVETLAHGLGVPEAPLWDGRDGLLFSDVRHGGVYRLDARGSIECVLPKRASGGMLPHAAGGIVLSGPDLVHLRDGQTRLLATAPGPGWAVFNDLTADEHGRILIGTLKWRPHKNEAARPGELWRVGAPGAMECIYADVEVSNGMAFVGDTFVHADTMRRRLIVHTVIDGWFFNRRVVSLAELGQPDGMAVDADGGVWVAMFNGGCVVRIRGTSVQRVIRIPARRVTNVCFGGAELRDLFVLASDNEAHPARRGTIFRVRLDVPGRPVTKAVI